LADVVRQLDEREKAAKADIQRIIDGMPNFSYVKPVASSSSKCFTLMVSDLKSNWTPEYHDAECHKKFLRDCLAKSSLPVFYSTLVKLCVTNGPVYVNTLKIVFNDEAKRFLIQNFNLETKNG
jgi:hypothetical protein